jgi:hypothetical protein
MFTMQRLLKDPVIIILAILLAAYVGAQFFPTSLGIHFAHSRWDCSSGRLSFIEPIGSTCGSEGTSFIGFPFAFNQADASSANNVVGFFLDLVPVICVMILIRHRARKHNQT